jgi:hypothetical protein
MLVLVFRKKNFGVDVDLVSEGNGVSLRQVTVGRPHTLIGGHYVIFISPKGTKKNDNVKNFPIVK